MIGIASPPVWPEMPTGFGSGSMRGIPRPAGYSGPVGVPPHVPLLTEPTYRTHHTDSAPAPPSPPVEAPTRASDASNLTPLQIVQQGGRVTVSKTKRPPSGRPPSGP
jgi:hypothetical protein